jgi:hypothetical protein
MWPARSRAWPLCSHRARSIMPTADLGAAAWPRFSWCALSADPAAHIRVSEGDARSLCQAIPEVRRIAAAFVVGLGWVCSAGNAGRCGVTLAGVAVQVQDRVRARHASTAGYSARALGPQVGLQIGGGGGVQSAAPGKPGAWIPSRVALTMTRHPRARATLARGPRRLLRRVLLAAPCSCRLRKLKLVAGSSRRGRPRQGALRAPHSMGTSQRFRPVPSRPEKPYACSGRGEGGRRAPGGEAPLV